MRRTSRLSLEALVPYLLEVPKEPGPLDWAAVFGNANHVEIEVGFGKGLFLVTAGQACPQTNFLGVEVIRKYQLFTATRLAKRGLTNVRLACTDARAFLRDYVAGGCVQALHVYFPDPWWKKRHHKRRVFTAEFAQQCQRVLRPGGRLHVLTDVQDYYTIITELLARQPSLKPLENADRPLGLEYLTNFERKYRLEGRPIYGRFYERQ